MTSLDRTFHDAREWAGELLLATKATGPFLADLFDRHAPASGLDARDRRLAYELAGGVIRHRRSLDCVVNAFARQPIVKAPPPLRVLLRLGAYQLLFLDRVPDHAAVDQTVELAKRWSRRKLGRSAESIGGFVNGLLRALAASRTEQPARPGVADPSSPELPRLVERPGSDRCCLLDRDVFASPAEAKADYLADAYSFEPWLTGRWLRRLGWSGAIELARAQNRRAGLAVRVNTLRGDTAQVAEMLAADGVRTRVWRAGSPVLVVLEGDPLASKALLTGLIQPQDPWSATIVPQLRLKAGMTVLDRCAAPGVKATQIAELMGDKGLVVAVDVTQDGLDRVRQNARRMGCHVIQTVLAERMPEELIGLGRIDRVLVDAPCSNSGVLARRPEARWRLSAETLAALAAAQRQLLMDALNWVGPGGRVVYATCSIEPEENEQVVRAVLGRRHGAARLIDSRLTLPSLADDHDGGYWAAIERTR